MPYRRIPLLRRRGLGDAQCGSGLVPTGNPLTPCVYPGVDGTSSGGGNGSGNCMQYSDFLAAMGGFQSCDTKDFACIACNQQKSAALSNLVGGGCVPVGSSVSFSCDTSQSAVQAMQNNSPVVNNATVNGTADTGWVVGTPLPTYSAPTPPAAVSPAPVYSSPKPTPAAPVSATAALQAAQSSVTAPSDWLTQSMFGGFPNWGLLAGGVGALFLFMSMGGRH